MALFKDPVVVPSGETYDRATVLQLKADPLSREPLPNASTLPPNRAIARQVLTRGSSSFFLLAT